MAQTKFFDVSLSGIDCDAANDLKLKAAVLLSPSEADGKQILECRREKALIGRVCDAACDGALAFLKRDLKAGGPQWPVEATVRTIKRDPSTKAVSTVQECNHPLPLYAYVCYA